MTRIESLQQSQIFAVAGRPPAAVRSPSAGGPATSVQLPDQVEISAAAQERLARDAKGDDHPKDPSQLDDKEKQEVAKLKQRDQEVRSHEQAHLSALGGEGGSASFQYETGPDGRRYAVEGEVPVSIGEVPGDPQATIEKARRVARAAVAPAQPSSADQRARARAQQVEAEARQKLADEKKAEAEEAQSKPNDATRIETETGAASSGDGTPGGGDVGAIASAALGLVTGLASAPKESAVCGVCHPDRSAGKAPAISVTIKGK